MKNSRSKNPRGLFIILSIYIFLQFIWWMTLLIRYNPTKKWMVLGEGAVFLTLLIVGIYTIYKAVRHEIELARVHRNFLLAVTHELKTPVAAGKLFLQTLIKRDFEKEKQNELIQKALHENERLSTLIDKVLLATTLDNSAFPINLKPQSLSDSIHRLCTQLMETLGKDHRWVLEIEPNIILPFDEESMQSIAHNLLENALKYSKKGTEIGVQLSHKNQLIQLRISDQGIGVEKKDLPYIFEKFYRAGNEDTRSAKGTGLGLFIVKNLVELHHGTIRHETNSIQGCTFVIEFNGKA